MGNVLDIARGGSPRPIQEFLTTDEDGVNWIKIGDTQKGGKYINFTKEKIKPSGVSKSRLVHKGDFLLTNSMSFGRPYILNVDGCIHDGWLVFSDFFQVFHKEFLYHILSSQFAYAQFIGKVSGAVVKNLNSEKVADSIFPLPPLTEQKRVAAAINCLFEILTQIDKEQAELSNLAALTKSKILDLAMRGKLVPQDPNDEPASELLKRLSPSHKPHYQATVVPLKIPDTWRWCPLGNIASIICGVSYEKCDITKSGIRILRGGNIQNGALVLEEGDVFLLEKYKNAENSVKRGDIVIVGSTGSERLIGKAGFALKNYENTQIGAFLRIVRPKPSFVDYLHLILKSDYYTSYIRRKAKGTNINNIKINYLNEFAIPIPPENEQKRIVKMAGNMLTLVENLYK